ncbi:sigma factor regulator N-terminal domain-containing protein [Priestia megaterium]|uniref:sigma factor regulator N-terminal domain-containing protein n=1 Tax=Priestia megaterium TaxID=1404 RepID=UPI001BEABC72|nr:sigma factor regulator N-terminal domain-containing protein [Priestia megaterium]MBT2255919.1 sigma factor regulator N-terminal domain-containing protein [Priestia megaterium]MBT2280987.1 sigma factor regulator N-terminal domain-containing protein [Priestia megaterium]
MKKGTEDEKQLDLFLEDKEFEKTMRKARRKAVRKNVIITAIVLFILYGAIKFTTGHWLASKVDKEDIAISRWLYITEPNLKQDGSDYDWSLFSAEGTHYYTKTLGERPIPWESITEHYNLIKASSNYPRWMQSYNGKRKGWDIFNQQNGQRELIFYHPRVNYKEVPNDLGLLDKMESERA